MKKNGAPFLVVVLRLQNVVKFFLSGDGKSVPLDGINLEIFPNGHHVAIQGISGCGKTTLLHILGGLLAPDEGHIFWNEIFIRISEKNIDLMRGRLFGFVFQHYALIEELNVLENVLFPLRVLGKRQDRKFAVQLLNSVAMDHRQKHLPSMLSGGEKQRVAIARALIHRPPFLIADEPTGNLDEKTAKETSNFLFDLCRRMGITIIYATHNRDLASKAEYGFQLSNGKLVDLKSANVFQEEVVPFP